MAVRKPHDKQAPGAAVKERQTATGFEPDDRPIEPLTAETFVQRLESMTQALAGIDKLRRAMPGARDSKDRGE